MKYILLSFIMSHALHSSCKDDDDSNLLIQSIDSTVKVMDIQLSGSSGAYTFKVTLLSANTGCQQYADWWEILSPDGELLYRRILAHSYVNEQPFTRSGAPVNINENDELIIRGHMNTSGYGIIAFESSVSKGFNQKEISKDFAIALVNQQPLPENCTF